MGLFKKKRKPQQFEQPFSAGHKAASGGYVGGEPPRDPSLPGIAGWCGSTKAGEPRRFTYQRPDGKPDRQRGFWSDPDEY